MTHLNALHSALFCRAIAIFALVSTICAADEPKPTEVPDASTPIAKPVPVAEQLTKIVESMRTIETRLKDRETGDETQAAQQSVLEQLDALLNMPPETPPPSNGGGGGGNNSNPPPESKAGNGKSPNSQGSQSKPKRTPGGDPSQMRPKPATQPGGKERKQAGDSEERTGPNRVATTPAAKRQRLEVDVWGHLPEKLREQLLNSYGERMLPQYEEAVRRFYDQLADPPQSRPRR